MTPHKRRHIKALFKSVLRYSVGSELIFFIRLYDRDLAAERFLKGDQ